MWCNEIHDISGALGCRFDSWLEKWVRDLAMQQQYDRTKTKHKKPQKTTRMILVCKCSYNYFAPLAARFSLRHMPRCGGSMKVCAHPQIC